MDDFFLPSLLTLYLLFNNGTKSSVSIYEFLLYVKPLNKGHLGSSSFITLVEICSYIRGSS